MADFHSVELYGGATKASLPSTFADVSEIRQVPDNQEVYLDTNGFTSIVFDILERVDETQAASDEEALKFHLQDIVESDAAETRIWTSGLAHFAKLPKGTPAYTLLATTPPAAQQRNRPNEPDFVALLFTLVRLQQQNTDIVITVNVPHIANQYDGSEVDLERGRYGPLLEMGLRVREKLLESFEVGDWGLFVQD